MFDLSLSTTSICARCLADTWPAPGAAIHLDFAGNRGALNGEARPLIDLIECGRASTAWAVDEANKIHSFDAYLPRITDKGLTVYGSVQNKSSQLSSPSGLGSNAVLSPMPSEIGPEGSAGGVYRLEMPTQADTFLRLLAGSGSKQHVVSIWVKAHGPNSQFQITGPGIVGDFVADGAWKRFSVLASNLNGDIVIGNSADQYASDILIAYPTVTEGSVLPPPSLTQGTVAADRITLSDTALAQIGSTGTWLIDFDLPEDFQGRTIWLLTQGGSRRFIYKNAGDAKPGTYDGSTITRLFDSSVGARKIALAFDGDGVVAVDDLFRVTNGTTDLTTGNSEAIQLGGYSSTHSLNACIRSLIYWPHALNEVELLEALQ